MSRDTLEQIADGRTDLVFEYLAGGHPASSTDRNGVGLIKWCAYYGDVSAIRFLVAEGESLESLGDNLDLNGAVFHGHWQSIHPARRSTYDHGTGWGVMGVGKPHVRREP